MPRIAVAVLRGLAALLVGAFFAFVGGMKSFAPIATLAEHHSWTVWLPEPLGRVVGGSEMLCAGGLIVPFGLRKYLNVQRLAAWALVVNQAIAALFHLAHSETGALPQNAVLMALLLFVALAARFSKGENAG